MIEHLSVDSVDSAGNVASIGKVGRVLGARGVSGTLRVMPYSGLDTVLTAVAKIILVAPQPDIRLAARMATKIDAIVGLEVPVKKFFWQGKTLMLECVGIDNREQAEALKGCEIQLERGVFPTLPPNEFYQIDLLGFEVFSSTHKIGVLTSFIENSAQSVMCIKKTQIEDDQSVRHTEELIPFVSQIVLSVDLEARKIVVDWVYD